MSNEQFKIITHLVALRAFCKNDNITIKNLDKAIQNLTKVRDEMKEAEQKKLEEEQEQQRKIDIITAQMEELGVSAREVVNDLSQKRKDATERSLKRRQRYCYLDGEGEKQYWSGTGQPPAAIQKELDKGTPLEEFLVKK